VPSHESIAAPHAALGFNSGKKIIEAEMRRLDSQINDALRQAGLPTAYGSPGLIAAPVCYLFTLAIFHPTQETPQTGERHTKSRCMSPTLPPPGWCGMLTRGRAPCSQQGQPNPKLVRKK
jgi:hypothetical protein